MATDISTSTDTTPKLSKADFESDQEVRWCPGCGDYSVLTAVQKLLPTLGIARERFVFVSGIGCSSRFPYYVNTYGFHTIHGRAPAIATGVKLANPDLSVWLVTGDGDALSIGGNHFIHMLRRNVDIVVLLFNNRIYGLTKGQYSPTSEAGKITKSTPFGSTDHPVNPLALALGADATFVARTLDIDAKHMAEVLLRAQAHRGTSFVEIFQNCVIYNDDAFAYVSERSSREDHQLHLRAGELLTFGKNKDRGIRIDPITFSPEVVEFPAGDFEAARSKGVATFDPQNRGLANILSRLDAPNFPVPMGVLYTQERPTFDRLAHEQIAAAQRAKPIGEKSPSQILSDLYSSGETWEVSR